MISFYEKSGFRKSYKIKNFFVDNYEKPIYECGIRLTDMIYLTKSLNHLAHLNIETRKTDNKNK